ncbi:MAG: single-stranded-DNA-specific exonuclease RecJ [Vibrionaceae bacterium]
MVEIKRRPSQKTLPDLAAVPALLQRIYTSRGVRSAKELERNLTALLTANELQGIDEACDLLLDAMQKQQRIIVVGDFDADGATSSALVVRALHLLHYHNVDYLVPNRFDDGYGLSPDVVAQAGAKGAQLIITVDNGISSIDGVLEAKKRNIRVIVTDHHLPADELPAADAMINPNLPTCGFASKALAGVGVAFYFMLAVRAKLREQGFFAPERSEPNFAQLLDLVALGTVADVAVLDSNNRILVHQGLQRIRAGKASAGIQALLAVAKRAAPKLVAADLGFALGPRLNAAGRLESMSIGVELLLCEDWQKATALAQRLDLLNLERRKIEQSMKEEALLQCENLQLDQGSLPAGLVLYQPEWHQGTIGILASRLKEKFHRPVVVFADDKQAQLKGSARSVDGLNMRDLLSEISRKHPKLLAKFGGHAMAAGLSIAKKDLPDFSAAFNVAVQDVLGDEPSCAVVLSDGELTPDELTIATAQLLQDAGPWGHGFAAPCFDGVFTVNAQNLVAGKHLKLQLTPVGGGPSLDAIAFNIDTQQWPNGGVSQVHVAYRLEINEFRGQSSLQLMIECIKAL